MPPPGLWRGLCGCWRIRTPLLVREDSGGQSAPSDCDQADRWPSVTLVEEVELGCAPCLSRCAQLTKDLEFRCVVRINATVEAVSMPRWPATSNASVNGDCDRALLRGQRALIPMSTAKSMFQPANPSPASASSWAFDAGLPDQAPCRIHLNATTSNGNRRFTSLPQPPPLQTATSILWTLDNQKYRDPP